MGLYMQSCIGSESAKACCRLAAYAWRCVILDANCGYFLNDG